MTREEALKLIELLQDKNERCRKAYRCCPAEGINLYLAA